MKLAHMAYEGGSAMYRRDTADASVLEAILIGNRYRFPDIMQDWTVIDIGAHIGAASLLAAARGAAVVAYEPGPESFEILSFNVVHNDANVKMYAQAVGRPGRRRVFLDPGNTASNGEHMFAGREEEEAQPQEIVEWVDLSTIFATHKISHCHTLKMDCEGSEVDVIPQIISMRDQIDCVVGEIHAGMWPVPTPDLDREIRDAVEELRLYYDEEALSHCEFRWTRKENA